jgi:hypothetical protein
MLAEAAAAPGAGYGPGTAIAALAAVLFAVGAVLQHEAAEESTVDGALRMRRLVTRPAFLAGQGATVLGTASQVVALAFAPVAVVQPVLAGGLVVALGIRSVRRRCWPVRLEVLGAVLTTGGLAVFLVAARPSNDDPEQLPSTVAVGAAVAVAVLLVAGLASLFKHGPGGALLCGAAAGSAAGIAAVLISVGLRTLSTEGLVPVLAGSALWGALITAVVAQIGGQQAYSRGSLSWSLPALILLDPVAAVPAARLLLGERLEPGHAAVWLPAAAVAAAGVVLLARTGEGCRRPIRLRRPRRRADAGAPRLPSDSSELTPTGR